MIISRRSFLLAAAALPCVRRSGMVRLPVAPRLIAFGDSITFGDGGSAYANGWAWRVAAQLGIALDNRAVSGTGVAEHLAAIQAAPNVATDTILWLTGFNDQWRNTAPEDYRGSLRSALARIPGAYIGNCLRQTEAAYAVMPGHFGSIARVAQFNAIIAEEVRAAGCVLVDASAAYDPTNCDDRVHPNDAGHAQIARAFLAAMRRVVYVPTIGR